MARSLRLAWLAFALTITLVVFVAMTGFRVARDRLANQFAQQQYLLSLATARHLKDKFDSTGLCLRVLQQETAAGRDPLADTDRLAFFSALLDGSALTFVRFDDHNRELARWPATGEPVPAQRSAAALAAARPNGRPAPVLYQTADGGSRMLMVQALNRQGGLGVVLDLGPMLAAVFPSHDRQVYLVAPEELRIVAATAPLKGDWNFRRVFRTSSPALDAALARGSQSGYDTSAAMRSGTPFGEREPYLLGLQGMSLAGRSLVVVTAVPRRALVEHYLSALARWITVVGLVALLGLVSFVVIVLQSHAAAEAERRRANERNSLLQISLALLSERRLEEVLGRIVEEARALFHAEGATIALIDERSDQLEFRCVASRNPRVANNLSGLRLPRHSGVLGWVIDRAEAVLVADVRSDPRFSDTVDEQTGGQTMSLLCAPLVDQKGLAFGAIELVNDLENPFAASDLVLLQSLAVTASAAVERAVFVEQEARQQRLLREMEIARTVQQGLLPHAFPQAPGFDFCGASDPAREVGGDFFDFIRVSDRHIGVVIADVADKGLGAAMFMVMCRSLLYSCATREPSPARVLEELNSKILEVSSSNLFVTVFYGVLDLSTRVFTYTNAGHNPPYLCREGEAPATITVPGMALGVVEPLGLGEAKVTLQPGDRLVLYTDGITEAIDADEAAFGKVRLETVLTETGSASARDTIDALFGAVQAFASAQPQFDDMTLAVVRVPPGADSAQASAQWLLDLQTRG